MNAKRDALISLSLKALQSGTGASATAAAGCTEDEESGRKRKRQRKEGREPDGILAFLSDDVGLPLLFSLCDCEAPNRAEQRAEAAVNIQLDQRGEIEWWWQPFSRNVLGDPTGAYCLTVFSSQQRPMGSQRAIDSKAAPAAGFKSFARTETGCNEDSRRVYKTML